MLNDEFRRVNEELLPGEEERVASATEMTGMIPAGLKRESTARHYEELTPMHEQKPSDEEDAPKDE